MIIHGNGAPNLLSGTNDADEIFGHGGNDSLYGQGGNDTLHGGAGIDLLNGGTGLDVASYAGQATPIVANLGSKTVTFSGGVESIRSIEGVIGGSGNDKLLGGSSANYLAGGQGNDVLEGRGCNDTISGGTTEYGTLHEDPAHPEEVDEFLTRLIDDGRDTIDGGSGIDTLEIKPVEVVWYLTGTEGLLDASVNLAAGTLKLHLPNAKTDVLRSIENVVTSSGDDTVIGNNEANYIDVGNGQNAVRAGGGNDTIKGGWVDLGAYPYQNALYGEAGNDLIYSGGAASGDWFVTAATDLLSGGSGNDTLVGGHFITEMIGGSGEDRFVFTNEISGTSEEVSWGQHATIRDFNPAAGDRIDIDIVQNPNDYIPSFVGEVLDLNDLAEFQLGYVRAGADTVVRFGSGESGELAHLEITLQNYAGALAESDFLFT
jgi:Ca2+-binding RTX toxin-like protein